MDRRQKELNAWGLSDIEERFAIEFFATKNGTESCRTVFEIEPFSTATRKSRELLNRPEIKAYLQFLTDTVRNDRIMTAEEVLMGLTGVAKGHEIGEERHHKVYTKDRVKALELMAKHYLLLTDVSKQEIEQRVIIVDDLGDDNDNAIE